LTNYLQIIQEYTLSLTNTKTVSEVCWELTKNVIAHIGFEDCVVYLYDENSGRLIQVAAHGPKNPIDLDIYNPITLKPGEGIVGNVFSSGKAEIISNTRLDDRYVVDDQFRFSEIAVPILHNGKPIGVIDSEHSEIGFFNDDHRMILTTLASIASNKIVKTRAFDRLQMLNIDLEKRRAKEELRNQELSRLNAQLDEIIYSLSHDFRGPVLATRSLIERLHVNPVKFNEYYPMLFKTVNKLDSILLNIYYYSNNLRNPVQSNLVIPETLITDMIKFLRNEFKEEFEFEMHSQGAGYIETDESRLKVIVRSVLMNSIQFGALEGKPLCLKATVLHGKETCKIILEDNGPGIPERLLNNMDSVFMRGTSQSDGAGIGIFVCREVARRIGAKITWDSQPLDGTRVEIEISSKGL
jgi:signal transduction histidine kinase